MPLVHARPRAIAAAAAVATALALLPGGPAAAQVGDGGARVAATEDPVAAAIDLSRELILEGDASRVVLGRSDVFADNLAGAAATAGSGPLLLVDPAPAPLRDEVLAELDRVLGAREPGRDCTDLPDDVLVLGGSAAIDPAVEQQLVDAGYCIERLAGDERVGTSVAVAGYQLSLFLGPDSGSRGTLLIATAGNPADSAAASAWAALNGHQVVVTGSQALDQQVADLIQPGDTAWAEIILLGGEAALSAQVEADVRAAAGDVGTTVRRIAGQTRDDTAFVVATELFDRPVSGTAGIVEGYATDFWTYALPGAAALARFGAPLLYVQTDAVPSTTDTYLRQFPVEFLLTIGPESRISEATRTQAESSLGSGS